MCHRLGYLCSKPKVVRCNLCPSACHECIRYSIKRRINLDKVKDFTVVRQVVLGLCPFWVKMTFPSAVAPAGAAYVCLHATCRILTEQSSRLLWMLQMCIRFEA